MSLSFLKPDPMVRYIHESVTPAELQPGYGADFYRGGERPAVIVIDLQRGYVSPEPKPWVRGPSENLQEITDAAVAAAGRVIDAARAAGIPVIFTGDRYASSGGDSGVRGEKFPSLAEYLCDGEPWVEIDPRVAPRPGEPIIWKKASSAFANTYLVPVLQHRRVDTLVFVGAATSGCVRASVTDAVSANFRAVVVEEAVCDKNQWAHKATLFDLWRYVASVASMDEVLEWMGSLGGTPRG